MFRAYGVFSKSRFPRVSKQFLGAKSVLYMSPRMKALPTNLHFRTLQTLVLRLFSYFSLAIGAVKYTLMHPLLQLLCLLLLLLSILIKHPCFCSQVLQSILAPRGSAERTLGVARLVSDKMLGTVHVNVLPASLFAEREVLVCKHLLKTDAAAVFLRTSGQLLSVLAWLRMVSSLLLLL